MNDPRYVGTRIKGIMIVGFQKRPECSMAFSLALPVLGSVSLESARGFELYRMLAAGSRDCINFGNYAEQLQNRAR